MPILRQMLGRKPSSLKSRVRNYVANTVLGTKHSVVHENVINPGVTVPWHLHATEEVIVVLEGRGEWQTHAGRETYRAGDVIIVPPRLGHSLRNIDDAPLRQLCFFPGDPHTLLLEKERPGQTVEIFNAG